MSILFSRGQSYGALGRLSQHLSEDYNCNTFRQRIEIIYKRNNHICENIHFLSTPLLPLKVFSTSASDYREAVEYIVQDKLINFLVNQELQYHCVSRVRPSGYGEEKFIKEEAERVFENFSKWFVAVTSPAPEQSDCCLLSNKAQPTNL